MKRIGIVASKISPSNTLVYNCVVLILAALFAVLLVFMAGFAIFLAIYLIHGLTTGFSPFDFRSSWGEIIKSCMVALAITGGIFILCAVGLNIKIK
jgi:hypothetical protein